MTELRTVEGAISELRVHREIGYGPPDDHISVHVIATLVGVSGMRFGFPLRQDENLPVHKDWLEILRIAFTRRVGVRIEYEVQEGTNHIIRYVERSGRPTVPANLHLARKQGREMELVWDSVEHSQEYEVSFSGKRSFWFNHTGTRTTSTSNLIFEARKHYNPYVFKVRAKQHSMTSRWSEELTVDNSDTGDDPDNKEITYSTLLQSDIPHEGAVLYKHVVDPGPPARLISVSIAGNAFTPYVVQFLGPNGGRSQCGDPNAGAMIEPGNVLEGDKLEALYGKEQPDTPILLAACKLKRHDHLPGVDPIPVQITYRR